MSLQKNPSMVRKATATAGWIRKASTGGWEVQRLSRYAIMERRKHNHKYRLLRDGHLLRHFDTKEDLFRGLEDGSSDLTNGLHTEELVRRLRALGAAIDNSDEEPELPRGASIRKPSSHKAPRDAVPNGEATSPQAGGRGHSSATRSGSHDSHPRAPISPQAPSGRSSSFHSGRTPHHSTGAPSRHPPADLDAEPAAAVGRPKRSSVTFEVDPQSPRKAKTHPESGSVDRSTTEGSSDSVISDSHGAHSPRSAQRPPLPLSRPPVADGAPTDLSPRHDGRPPPPGGWGSPRKMEGRPPPSATDMSPLRPTSLIRKGSADRRVLEMARKGDKVTRPEKPVSPSAVPGPSSGFARTASGTASGAEERRPPGAVKVAGMGLRQNSARTLTRASSTTSADDPAPPMRRTSTQSPQQLLHKGGSMRRTSNPTPESSKVADTVKAPKSSPAPESSAAPASTKDRTHGAHSSGEGMRKGSTLQRAQRRDSKDAAPPADNPTVPLLPVAASFRSSSRDREAKADKPHTLRDGTAAPPPRTPSSSNPSTPNTAPAPKERGDRVDRLKGEAKAEPSPLPSPRVDPTPEPNKRAPKAPPPDRPASITAPLRESKVREPSVSSPTDALEEDQRPAAEKERVIAWYYDDPTNTWTYKELEVRLAQESFAQGGMRKAFHMVICDGDGKERPFVAKLYNEYAEREIIAPDGTMFGSEDPERVVGKHWALRTLKRQSGCEFEAMLLQICCPDGAAFSLREFLTWHRRLKLFKIDVEMQGFCQTYAAEFNKRNPPKAVVFLDAFLIVCVNREKQPVFTCEPHIKGDFVKHNNNCGVVQERAMERNTPQAFSHFTHWFSRHQYIIVDIQGVNDTYTDPQVHSVDRAGFGMGNLGQEGIESFFRTHRCNNICAGLGLVHPHKKVDEPAREGTMWPSLLSS
jgi:hypothetical protein